MDRGELVPDDVTISMIRERLLEPDVRDGVILDGFPRTLTQAKGLNRILDELNGHVRSVLYIEVPHGELIHRLSGRLVCRAEGHIYHKSNNPPEEPGVCDIDGSELYQREDDKEETVRHRIEVYLEQTEPLIEYYRNRDLLVEINGNEPVEEVTKTLLDAVQQEA